MGKMKELYTLEQEVAREAEIRLLERIDESIKQRQNKHTLWRLWAKALGEKASDCDRESDKVAVVRTIIAGINLATCIFIVAGIIRHW
jgi:hypothetical protein